MDPMRVLERQCQRNDEKILFLVMDGLGDLPRDTDSLTPLAAASTPNFDRLAADGACGRFDPVGPGITPGSGPGHLGLFGYDPSEHEIGRGVLSAVGIDFPLRSGDVAARFNFCTLDAAGKIVDRRAGRISTDENRRLVERLRELPQPEGVEVHVETESEHRGVLVLRGEALGHSLADTDPQETGVEPLPVQATDASSRRTAEVVEEFVRAARGSLEGEARANGLLLRGFDTLPTIRSLAERFRLSPVCIAQYPMYRGLARLVGMDMPAPPSGLAGLPDAVAAQRDGHDFIFVHVKYTDKAGEDGNFDRKVEVIEEVDELIPAFLDIGFGTVAVTADHSTPVPLRAHSWHPVPGLVWSPGRAFRDGVQRFTEIDCIAGGLGRMSLRFFIAEVLACAGKVAKYGA